MKKSAGKKIIFTKAKKQEIFSHFDAAILSLNKLHLKLENLCPEQRAATEMKTGKAKRHN